MIPHTFLCEICQKSLAAEACVCEKAAVLICSVCKYDHASSAGHKWFSIELGLRMREDPGVYDRYMNEILEVRALQCSLELYAFSIHSYEAEINSAQATICREVERRCGEASNILSGIKSEIGQVYSIVTDYARTMCDEGRVVMEIFRMKGEQGLFQNYIGQLSISVENVMESIRNMIQTGNRVGHNWNIGREDTLEYNEEMSKDQKIYSLKQDLAYKEGIILQLQQECTRAEEELQAVKESERILKDQLLQRESEMQHLRNMQHEPKHQPSRIPEHSSIPNDLPLAHLSINLASPEERCRHFSYYFNRRYIYTPKNNTKKLIEYDILEHTFKIYQLNGLFRKFMNTSSCMLPHGDVFLAGSSQPLSGDAYIFRVADRACVQVASLPNPRYQVCLYYYQGFVYAFGGLIGTEKSRKAERFSLEENTWETLESMSIPRNLISCVGVEDILYLFCGGNSRIELFHIPSKSYKTINLTLNSTHLDTEGLAVISDNLIYLITQTSIEALHHDLTPRYCKLKCRNFKSSTLNNTLFHKGSVYFADSSKLFLNKIDTFLISPNSMYSQGRDVHKRYIYSTIDSPSSLLRFDVKCRSVRSIEMNIGSRTLESASLCMLPWGDVIITGLRNPVGNECYIWSMKKESCALIATMNTARYGMGLFHSEGFVYAFGGKEGCNISRNVEILSLKRRCFDRMPEMIQGRYLPFCVGVDNKIYVMAGRVQSVEVFDIMNRSFSMMSLNTGSYYVVSMVCDSNIYIIGDSSYKICDKNLNLLEEHKDRGHCDKSLSTRTNTIYLDRKIYFINDEIHNLEAFKTHSRERKIIIIKR